MGATGDAAFTSLVGGVTVTETGTGATRTVQVQDIYSLSDSAHPKRFLRLSIEEENTAPCALVARLTFVDFGEDVFAVAKAQEGVGDGLRLVLNRVSGKVAAIVPQHVKDRLDHSD